MSKHKKNAKVWTAVIEPIKDSEDVMVMIPEEIIKELGLDQQDEIEWEISAEGSKIFLRPKIPQVTE